MTYRVQNGLVYLVGAGPGDPGLLSIKAKSILEQADVVIYDNLVNPKVLEWLKPQARSIFVGKSSGQHSIPQEEINALLVKEVQNDVSIVRLKGGDPLIFGRAGEEVNALDSAGIHYEIVPGITAAIACAAYAGIPISQRNISSSIIFLTGHENPEKTSLNLDFKEYAKSNATLCIYMGIGQLKRITGELLEGGLNKNTPVAIIENGTYVKQRSCFSTLSQIIEDSEAMSIKPPAIVFVGDVVNCRSQYNWFEEKPLFGKKILVPRPRKQAGELSQLLEDYGADVLEVPFIDIQENYDRDSITNVFTDITSYEWIVFTSSNGVDLFFDLLYKAYQDIRSIGLSQIATVGRATARAVRSHKLKVSLMPKVANSNSLADALIENQTLDNVKILLVTGDKNSDVLFKRLQDEGRAIVDRLPLYKNIRTDLSKNENFKRFKESGADCVLFTSSSTVHNYLEATKSLELLDGLKPKFGSIGVKTSETLRKQNMPIAFESPKANLNNFVVETLSYFRNIK